MSTLTTTGSRFRTVTAPRGRLVHLDFLNDGRTDDVARSTSCGRRVPASWLVEATDAAVIVEEVTCPGCRQWAQFHVDREAVDAQLAERLGADWKDQPHRFLAAVDLQAAQALLARLEDAAAQAETPAVDRPMWHGGTVHVTRDGGQTALCGVTRMDPQVAVIADGPGCGRCSDLADGNTDPLEDEGTPA
jgi:hypothetical protein